MTIDWQQYRLYVHVICAAFISAAVTTLAGMVATPDLTYQQMVHTAIVGGVIGTAGYFTHSPLGK